MKKVPILGNMVELGRNRLAFLLEVHRKLGETGILHVGRLPVVSLTKPEHVHAVLVEHADAFEKGRAYEYLKTLLGLGLVTSSNELHRRQRKLVAPALAHRRVMGYAGTMVELGELWQRRWVDGTVIDVAEEMMGLTQAIVAKALFSANLLAESSELSEALTVSNEWAGHELSHLVHLPLWIPTPTHRRLKRAIERLDRTIYRLIRERRAAGDDTGDVLSMLLAAQDESGGGMTDRQVRDELLTLFLAGHETTANALSWSFHLLSEHLDVYQRMQAEIDQQLGGRPPTTEDLPHLPYTLQVLKEAMRIYPPVYLIGRRAVQDVPLGDFLLEAGSLVFVNIYGMHRRADLFPDPGLFNPDRFTADNERKIPKNAFLPFASGPRNCIGAHFAMMEGHLLLAVLAQRVTLERRAEHPVVEQPLITLRPKHGLQMMVRRRASPAGATAGCVEEVRRRVR
jgi:cytochrome P450